MLSLVYSYLGPCLTPAEVDARVKDALKWRDAINDALTNWLSPIEDHETPADALQRLIRLEVMAALDPAVSQSAADLVAQAKREALEEAARLAKLYAQNALKCVQCGDIRHDYNPGNCSGEKTYRESEEYKKKALFDGEYSAMRYFEKHLCCPEQMDIDEAFKALAAAIRALSDTPPGMVLVPREPTDAMIKSCLQAALDFMPETKTIGVHPGQTYPNSLENAWRWTWRAMVQAAGKGEGDE
ncbi:MAG: hypothetical protein ACK5X3_07970 [Pseudomonadota bacterium]